MSLSEYTHVCTILLCVLLLDSYSCLVLGNNSECPLWHIRGKDGCICGATLHDVIHCDEPNNIIFVEIGNCMTWDNITHMAIVNRCPFRHQLSESLCPLQGYYSTIQILPIFQELRSLLRLVRGTTDKEQIVWSAKMDMGLHCSLTTFDMLIVINSLNFGF